MQPKRDERNEPNGVYDRGNETAAAATVLRPNYDPPPAPATDDHKMSLFWRVFGGTILSIGALVAATLYNSVNAHISELRGEVTRLNEARAEWVKKDEFNTRTTTVYERVQALNTQNNAQNATLTAHRAEFDAVKEKLARLVAEADAIKKDTAVAVEALKKDVAAVEGMKEKLATMFADVKAARDDAQKLRQDVDKNLAYDQERKAFRDEQHRVFDKALKDVNAAVQECQVKMARLEGQAAATPATAPKPRAKAAEVVGPPK